MSFSISTHPTNSPIRATPLPLEDVPSSDPGRPRALEALVQSEQAIFDHAQSVGDGTYALENSRSALPYFSPDSPRFATVLRHVLWAHVNSNGVFDEAAFNDVGECVILGHKYSYDSKKLTDAIDILRQVLQISLPMELKIPTMNALSRSHFNMFYEKDKACDLDEAKKLSEETLKCIPTTRRSIAADESLLRLANALGHRYDRKGDVSDFSIAIAMSRGAGEGAAENSPELGESLDSLANNLHRQHDMNGELPILDEAIQASIRATRLIPEAHHNHTTVLLNCGGLLRTRYERTGHLDDLEESVKVSMDAFNSLPETSKQVSGILSNLGNSYEWLYERTGDLKNLDEAIRLTTEAVDKCPEHNQHHTMFLRNLGNKLNHRFEWLGNVADIQTALKYAKKIFNMANDGYSKALAAHDLSIKFHSLWRHADADSIEPNLMSKMLDMARHAVKHPSSNASSNGAFLANLSRILWLEHKTSGSLDALDESIKLSEEARESIPGHVNRCGWILQLGRMYRDRYHHHHHAPRPQTHESDLDQAYGCFTQVSNAPEGDPLTRVRASRAAIRILQQRGDCVEAAKMARHALGLLPLIASRYLSTEDLQHAVVQTSGLAADACALTLQTGTPEVALEQLEFGRGLMLGYLLDRRSDLSTLRKDSPELAEKYERLQFKLFKPPAGSSREDGRRAVREAEEHIAAIRQVPRHERFLLELKFDDISKIAAEGAIIAVNATDLGSDAIILTDKQVKRVPLPQMSENKHPFVVQRYARFREPICQHHVRDIAPEKGGVSEFSHLPWLWKVCVKPVLDELDTMGFPRDGESPRVWWIGSGAASSLPFHAAGIPKSLSESTLGRVISSYTPTAKVLRYSRLQSRARIESKQPLSILGITMPQTPSQGDLPGVDREWEAVQKTCQAQFACDELRLPNAADVLGRIPSSDIIHIACHGSSDPLNPLGSHVLLQKTSGGETVVVRLTVDSIADIVTKGKSWIAYLSVCSAAEIKESRLADEGFHLTSSFLLAGFGHSIGSLFSVDDDVCVRLAELFYTELARRGALSDGSVALALHSAVSKLRMDPVRNPYEWVPFVHFGA